MHHGKQCEADAETTKLLQKQKSKVRYITNRTEVKAKKMMPSLLLPRRPVVVVLLLVTAALLFVENVTSFVIPHTLSTTTSSMTNNGRQQQRVSALNMEVIETDVAIIGGGPAGCTCALYTSRAALNTVILDKNPAVGALAITSHIANYPGVDRTMSGAELLEQMRTQCVQYGTRYERAQVFMIEAEEVSDENPYNRIVYTPDVTVRAKSLVLATGAMGRAMPPFPGEAEYLGKGVSYCATCDAAFYGDADVAVYGATNEAVEEALFLTKFAKTVHWITSTDVTACFARNSLSTECNKMIDEEPVMDLLSKSNVKHYERNKLLSVEGDVSGVTGVTIKAVGGSDPEPHVIPVEGAFIYGAGGGSKPITDFCQSQVDLDDSGGVVVDIDTMETSVKGVFAIGDIRNTDYKQVVVAAADGCMAAMSIEKYVKKRKTVKVDWIHK